MDSRSRSRFDLRGVDSNGVWRRPWRTWPVPCVLALALLLVAPVRSESTRSSDLAKRESTRELMATLIDGIFGSRHGVGYLGDMGEAPASLELLAAASASPPYSTSNQGGVGMGYNGPYVPRPGTASATFVDAWNTPLAIESTASSLRLRSAGPDRDPTTTEDNVYFPLQGRTTHGTVEVTVRAVPEAGGAPSVLDASQVAVSVYYASSGVEASTAASYDSAEGVFEASALHVGRHYVRATALEPEDFAVASRDTIVWLRGRSSRVDLLLVLSGEEEAEEEEPEEEEEEEEEGVVLCHNPGGKIPQTMTVAASAASAHFGHGDSAGPCE